MLFTRHDDVGEVDESGRRRLAIVVEAPDAVAALVAALIKRCMVG